MLIEANGKTYPWKGIEGLTLKHIAALQYELRSGKFDGITSLRTLDEIRGMFVAYSNMSKSEQRAHPESLFLTCFTIWSARVLAGDAVTLTEAIDVPATSIRFIREPADRQSEPDPKARPSASAGGSRPGKRRKRR